MKKILKNEKKQSKTKIFVILSIVTIMIVGVLLLPMANINVAYAAEFNTDVTHKASVLIEKNSGEVLFENNSHDKLPIASVTKLMTVLLTLEEVDAGRITLEDKVMVSKNANGMGGSQIFLDADTEYVLGDLLKSVIVASANDSSVAIAEYIAGSENNFVRMMNERANELKLNDTNYSNCTGLPTADGYSSAYDQALLLREVLGHDVYHNYSSIWLEDFVHPSGRTTQMANTNKLARFYDGCIGGKTGSTNQAKYCLAVGAKRADMELIAVVLGADNSKERFNLASNLLNYGFENFEAKTLFDNSNVADMTIKIKGMDRSTHIKAERNFTHVCKRGEEVNFALQYNLPNMLHSVRENQVVGNVEIVIDGKVVDKINLLATDTHNEATVWDYFRELTKA